MSSFTISPEIVQGDITLRSQLYHQIRDHLKSLDTQDMLTVPAILSEISPNIHPFEVSRVANGAFGTVYCLSGSALGEHAIAMKIHHLADIIPLEEDDMDSLEEDLDDEIVTQQRIDHAVICLENGDDDVNCAVELNQDSECVGVREKTTLELVNLMVLEGVCPFYPLTYFDRKGRVSRQFFMEYSASNLKLFLPKIDSLGMAVSICRQQLVSLLCLNSILGLCHNDNYPHNNLVDKVVPGIYQFRFDGETFTWFNYGHQVKMADFGHATGTSFLNICSMGYGDHHYDHIDRHQSDPSSFTPSQMAQFDNLHILQFSNMPIYARDLVVVLAAYKNTCLRSLSVSDTIRFKKYIDGAATALGDAIYKDPEHLQTRQSLWKLIKTLLSVNFLSTCTGLPLQQCSDLLVPPPHSDVPITECGITNTCSPKYFDKYLKSLLKNKDLCAC